MDRREFLRSSASLPLLGLAPTPARIRGRVSSRGRGVAGVVVSDSLSSVANSASGEFELVTGQ